MPQLHWVQFSVFAGELTRTAAEDLLEPIRSGADAALEDLALLGERADLTFVLVHVDANVFHG